MLVRAKLFLLFMLVSGPTLAHPFTVGVSAPLTGDLAEYGEAVRNGFSLSSAGGPSSSIRLLFEDNKYDAKEAVSAYRSLVTMKKIDLLFSWGEAPLSAIAPLVERAGIPTVAMSVDAKPAAGKESIIIAINPPRQFANTVLTEIRNRGFRHVCFVATDDPFFSALITEFRALVSSEESIDVLASVQPQEREFRALVTKFKTNRSCDVLGAYLLSGQVGAFYRELTKQNVTIPSFGTDVFESRAEIQSAGTAIRGAVYPNLFIPGDFRERYQRTFGKDSQISFAYNAYMVGEWLHTLFGRKDHLSRSEIVNLLHSAPTTKSIERITSEQRVTYLSFPLTLRTITEQGFEDLDNRARSRAALHDEATPAAASASQRLPSRIW